MLLATNQFAEVPVQISTADIVFGVIGLICFVLFFLAMFGDLIFGSSKKQPM